MNIAHPAEGRSYVGVTVPVVVEGDYNGELHCGVMTPHDWEGVVLRGERPQIACSEVMTCAKGGVFTALLRINGAWRGPVVVLVLRDDGQVATARSIVLGRSPAAPIRSVHEAPKPLLWPMVYARSAVTTFEGLAGSFVSVETPLMERAAFFESGASQALLACNLEQPAQTSAVKSLRRDLCVGADLPAFAALEARMTWTAPPLYLLQARDALIDLENGVLIDEEGRIWSDSAVATLSSNSSMARTSGWFQAGGEIGLALDTAPDQMTDERPAMMFCHWASTLNHAHWIMNSLVSVFHVLPELRERRLDLLCPPLTSEQRRQIHAIGVPREALIECESRFVRVPRLVFPSALSTMANMYPPPSSLGYFKHLKACCRRELLSPPTRVFFTRNGFNSARRIRNGAEVEALLKDSGFICVAPHELSLSEEIDLMSRAEIVVAQLGAALTNIAFAPIGTRVIELTSSNYTSNEYCLTASLVGLEYVRLMSDPVAESVNGGAFEFLVDLEALQRAVTES